MIIPHSSLYWLLVNCNLPSASILDITFKCNQTVCSLSLLYVGFSRLIRASFLFIVEKYSILCINHILFIHSSVKGPLRVYLLTIMDNFLMNIGTHAFSKNIPRGGIVASCGKIMFNFLSYCQIVFHWTYTIWLSHAQALQSLHILSNTCFPYFRLLWS